MKTWKNNDGSDDYRGFSIQIQSGQHVARDGWGRVVFTAENTKELELLIDELLDGEEV